MALSGYFSIEDSNPGIGPLEGLRSVFSTMKNASAFLVVPVDMPFLTETQFKQLCRERHERSEPYDGIMFSNQTMPVLLENSVKVFDRIHLLLKEGVPPRQRSIQALLEGLKVLKLDSDLNFINLNTPEDLER